MRDPLRVRGERLYRAYLVFLVVVVLVVAYTLGACGARCW